MLINVCNIRSFERFTQLSIQIFIGLTSNHVIPIEIKAGATGRLRSLLNFMDEVKHPWAIRLYASRISINELKTSKGKPFYLLNLPYYLASKLEEYIEWLMSIRPE